MDEQALERVQALCSYFLQAGLRADTPERKQQADSCHLAAQKLAREMHQYCCLNQ